MFCFVLFFLFGCLLLHCSKPTKELLRPLLPAFEDQFNLPCAISFTKDAEVVSFQNIQLSTQGAERQRKDAPSNHIDKLLFFVQVKGVFNTMYMCCFPRNLFPPNQNDSTKVLKVANRFEILINQRKNMEEYKDMNDLEILQSIAGRYNSYKATAALKKWQLSVDFVNAIAGIILGVCPEARQELQNHLNHNKWTESGNSMAIVASTDCFFFGPLENQYLGNNQDFFDDGCLFFVLALSRLQ